MNWLSTVAGLLAGLAGRELWEWLPVASKAVIFAVTRVLPSPRREVRCSEWTAELEHYKHKRVAGLLWSASLLPICVWETATAPAALRRLWSVFPLLVLLLIGILPFALIALEISAFLNLPLLATIFLFLVTPLVLPVVLMIVLGSWAYLIFRAWDRLESDRDRSRSVRAAGADSSSDPRP